jgi:hypothetical protein
MDTIASADEQGERIMANYSALTTEAEETGIPISFAEFEEVFEDRDPFEFI